MEIALDFWTDRFTNRDMKGRPKEFDVELAMQNAMDLFWQYGYKATSLGDLLGVMGISKSSFYAEFQSKEQLFKGCFASYVQGRIALLDQALADSSTTEEFLKRVFSEAVRDASSGNPKGCLMSNSASEFGQHEPAFRQEVRGAFETIQGFLEAVLKQGMENGEVAADDSPRLLAQYLTTSLSGVRTMVKGGMKPAEARAVVNKVLRAVLG